MAKRIPLMAAVAVLLGLAGASAPAGAQVTNPASGVDYEVLTTNAKDPLFIQVADDGRVFWVEREGRIQVLHPDGVQADVGFLPASANECNEAWCPTEEYSLEEGGLYSILLDRNFSQTGKVYLYYSVPGSFRPGDFTAIPGNAYNDVTVCFDRSCQVAPNFGTWRLSTFTIDAQSRLVPGSEQMILEVPVEWLACCHHGGNLEWLPDGTILLSTGDDLAATVGSYGQTTDPLFGDGERSSQNPSDRRGKVLRLMPDGSIPDGSIPGTVANPYLQTDANGVALRDAACHLITEETVDPYVEDLWGDPSDHMVAYDPYVYALGYKQPFRGAVHPYTGRAIFGEVGPDGFVPDENRGPRGMEELNEIPYGGGVNHGWPRCSANNVPYREYDWQTQTAGPEFDCSAMEPSVLWYPHDVSDRWPVLGTGLVTSIPAAFYPADTNGPMALPAAFDDTLIYMEFSRHSVIAMPVTREGNLVTDMTRWTVIAPPNGANLLGLLPSQAPIAPIDATVGPDGAIYFLEYGQGFYNGAGGKVSRLKCAGCTDARSPRTPAATSVSGGRRLPLAMVPLPAVLVIAALLVPVIRRRRSVV